MFVRVKNGDIVEFPYTLGALRRDNPNISFQKNITNDVLSSFGVFPVSYESVPEHNNLVHRIVCAPSPVLREGSWVLPRRLEPLPEAKVAERRAEAIDRVRDMRRKAYALDADPLFFKWQRGSATKDEWLAAVAAVKAQYPYPE